MNFLRILISLIALVAIGIFLEGVAFDRPFGLFAIQNLQEYVAVTGWSRAIIALGGLLSIAVAFLNLQKALVTGRRERLVSFEGNEGLSITVDAVEDLVKKNLEDRNIAYVKPRVVARKKKLEIAIDVSLDSDTNIPDFAEETQAAIKDKLQNILGGEKEIAVRIKVRKIIVREKQEPGQEPEVPFRNY